MVNPKQSLVDRILENYGRTFSQELKIHVEKNTPSPLFRLLTFSLLSSTRISYQAAMEAAGALAGKGWNTAEKMAAATWSRRTEVLNKSGYARYDESTSRMLGETADLLLEKYKGDLRNLRAEADRDPAQERKLLKQFKGIGDVGVDIFFREAQTAWDELLPFADERALKAARQLNLGGSGEELLQLVKKADYVRFVAALVRIELENGYGALRE